MQGKHFQEVGSTALDQVLEAQSGKPGLTSPTVSNCPTLTEGLD